MGGPENCNFPLLYLVKYPYIGGWVVQKRLKTPLRNIKMAPYVLTILPSASVDCYKSLSDILLSEKYLCTFQN